MKRSRVYIFFVFQKRIQPANRSKTVIADIGCGNRPQIAMSFPDCLVHSYDLYSPVQAESDKFPIISSDMSRLPLNSNYCDYIVYSLSLMPTNLRDCFYEANRILKQDGYMLIVEVASRFSDYKNSSKNEGNQEKHPGYLFAHDLKAYGFQLTRHELLQPNGYFIYFSFKKNFSLESAKVKSSLPQIALKACFYKSR